MTWIKKQTDGTHDEFNFVAPEGKTSEEVLFPVGEVLTPDYAATLAVDIAQMETFLQPAELTGNATINLNVADQVTKGAKLHLKIEADTSTRTATLGAGFADTPVSIAVSASKVAYMSFVYDGTTFLPTYEIPT